MPSVFVSSQISGFEDYRAAARDAIQRHGWVPVMSEFQPAQDLSPRDTLLAEVARADVYLLLVGSSYGTSSQPSPTEQEYEEAVRHGKPVIVLVQDGAREPAQQEFIDRVSAGWEDGRYRASFDSPAALGREVAFALGRIEKDMRGDDDGRAAAIERAESLVGASAGPWGSMRGARVVVVPVGVERIISHTRLNDDTLAGQIVTTLRAAGLADPLAGFKGSSSAKGIEVEEKTDRHGGGLRVSLAVDGALTVEGPVEGDGQLGSMWIDPDRLASMVRGALSLAPGVWSLVGSSHAVRTAAIQCAMLDGAHKSFGRPRGNSMSMGGSMRLSKVIVPEAPEIVPVVKLATAEPTSEILAQIERIYRDAGSVNS